MNDNASPLAADEAALREALAVIRPDGGTLLLVSIDPQPGRPTAGRTFTLPAQTEDAVRWAVNENGRSRNLHFTVNGARDGLSKKSAKTDMRDAYMCWADLDPDIVTHESYERARAYLTDRFLPTLLETATMVVDSGNGLQAFWRLREPIALDSADGMANFETANRALEKAFNCDKVHNADRVMRLPGTLNYPNPAKLAKGYPATPSIARVLFIDIERSYTLMQIRELATSIGATNNPMRDAPILNEPGNRTAELEPGARPLGARFREVLAKHPKIKARYDGSTDGLKDSSGSAMDFSMVSMLRKCGFDFGETVDLLWDWPYGSIDPQRQQLPGRYWERCWRNTEVSLFSGAGGDELTPIDDERTAGRSDKARVTEDVAALMFSQRYADTLRYCHQKKSWLGWRGSHWAEDQTLAVFDLVRNCCRQTDQSNLMKAAAVAAVERLAASDRRHATLVADFDADPWLLNTPGGVVDLHTGALRPHDPGLLMTKITRGTPTGTCPLWLAFLGRVTNGDDKLAAFLQCMAGYALTGSIREHALFFLYGNGQNGKGVFINTLKWVLGDYATVAAMATFQASQNDRHPTDLAMLNGARMVAAQETEKGRRWDETRIKALTGGDPISARFMRCDFFTFEPEFKLIFAGNDKPSLTAVDPAMRRRMNMVPFSVEIPKCERDETLSDKLKGEADGIMAWALEGCLAWQRGGLNPPACVLEATAEYFEEQDTLAAWRDECCEQGPTYWQQPRELYQSWRQWCEAGGEQAGTEKTFVQMLEKSGFKRARSKNKRRVLGVRLKDLRNLSDVGDADLSDIADAPATKHRR